jgi:hypothetical protein
VHLAYHVLLGLQVIRQYRDDQIVRLTLLLQVVREVLLVLMAHLVPLFLRYHQLQHHL